jgi:hypothetical protein
VLKPLYLTNGEQMQIIDNWDELLHRSEYKTVASIWNSNEDMVRKVASLDASDILKTFTPNNPNGFYVDVKIRDNSILPELQQAIVNGLNNSDYIKERLAARKEDLKIMIDKVTDEITKIDSTKIMVDRIMTNKEKFSSSLMLDVSGLNRQQIELNEKLLGYKSELRFANGVNVLQGFSRFDNPVSASLRLLIVVGLIIGTVVAYIITLFVIVRERMRRPLSRAAA